MMMPGRYKIYPVNFGIIVDDFNSFTEIQRRFLTGATLQAGKLVTSGNPSKPYFLPFQHCMKTVASYAPVGGEAHFYFGVDRPVAKYATSLYTMIKTTGPHHEYNDRLGDVSYPLASQTPQLQAADCLALMTYQYMLEKYRKQDWEMMPPPKLVACVSKTRMAGDHFLHNRDTLQASLRSEEHTSELQSRQYL